MSEGLFDAGVWIEDNDEDELRAACACGWRGEWRDLIRAANDDRAAHIAEETR